MVIIIIETVLICILVLSSYFLRRQNKKMELVIMNITSEMIELEKDYEESLQTIKELQKLYGKNKTD